MVKIEEEVKLDFDDVLIKPKWSNVPSRADVKMERTYTFLNSKVTWTGLPVIAANMDTVGTFAMARELSRFNMMTCLHKHYCPDDLVNYFRNASDKELLNVFYTLGIRDTDFDKLNYVLDRVGPDKILNFCLDVPNAYTQFFLDKVKYFRERFPDAIIMAGNVCSSDVVHYLLLSCGADICKIGIGGGSACTTRLVTGVGVPQLSACLDCAEAAHGIGGHICSDGGVRRTDDLVKAMAAGSHFVMCGGFFAGHDECEGKWHEERELIWPEDGSTPISTGKTIKKYLTFYGMASQEANDKYYGGVADHRAVEGKCVKVPYKGAVSDTVKQIQGALRSACTYVGASRLKDLPKCTTFVRVNRTHNRVFSYGFKE